MESASFLQKAVDAGATHVDVWLLPAAGAGFGPDAAAVSVEWPRDRWLTVSTALQRRWPGQARTLKIHVREDMESSLGYDAAGAVDEKAMVVRRRWVASETRDESLWTAYVQESLMPFAFPWNTELHDMYYATRMSMRVHSRVYLTWEQHMDAPDATPRYVAYVRAHVDRESLESVERALGTVLRAVATR